MAISNKKGSHSTPQICRKKGDYFWKESQEDDYGILERSQKTEEYKVCLWKGFQSSTDPVWNRIKKLSNKK